MKKILPVIQGMGIGLVHISALALAVSAVSLLSVDIVCFAVVIALDLIWIKFTADENIKKGILKNAFATATEILLTAFFIIKDVFAVYGENEKIVKTALLFHIGMFTVSIMVSLVWTFQKHYSYKSVKNDNIGICMIQGAVAGIIYFTVLYMNLAVSQYGFLIFDTIIVSIIMYYAISSEDISNTVSKIFSMVGAFCTVLVLSMFISLWGKDFKFLFGNIAYMLLGERDSWSSLIGLVSDFSGIVCMGIVIVVALVNSGSNLKKKKSVEKTIAKIENA